MYIYKITNKINNKMYIGQTIRPVEDRWKRHINDALNNILDTHFARAIRYYKPENLIKKKQKMKNLYNNYTNTLEGKILNIH